MQIAREEEKGVYLNFLNFLINDSIYLLDESLNKILELKEIEAEMANSAEWERRPAQEREERMRLFHSRENVSSLRFYYVELSNMDFLRLPGLSFNYVSFTWALLQVRCFLLITNLFFQIVRFDMRLANEDVGMLAFTSEQIPAPFLLPEMVRHLFWTF